MECDEDPGNIVLIIESGDKGTCTTWFTPLSTGGGGPLNDEESTDCGFFVRCI